jgi:hypothetical protein
MPSLTELSTADLRDAGDAVETLIDFRDYLPPGGMLLMLAGKFRDDVRELLRMPPVGRVSRSRERKHFKSMEDADLDRLGKAVAILNSRFSPCMDDPELARLIGSVLGELAFEKAARRVLEEAKAS